LAGSLHLRKKTKSEFRKAIGVLKKVGIVDVKNVNDAQPYWVRKAGPKGGTYTLSELVDKYDDIISGKATPVKLSSEKTAFYKRQGYETVKGDKIVVPHVAGGKVKVNRQGDFYRLEPPGIKTTTLPVEYHNLEQYLTELKSKHIKREKGKYFSFRFFGGHSQLYSSIDLLIDDLQAYKGVLDPIRNRDAREMNEVFRNLEIVETTKAAWSRSKKQAAEYRRQSKSRNKPGARRRRLERAEATGKGDIYRDKRAAEMRAYRANMSPEQKAEYNRKARQRNKKNRS